MSRDFLTNKWIIGGFLLLIIIAGGCYFWYQHSLAADRKASADAQQLLRQLEIERKAKQKAATETETTSTKEPVESTTPTAEKPKVDATALTDNTESSQTEAPAQNAETEEVRVSKFGFGPYPEIPPDFPYPDLFDPQDHPYYADNPNHPYKDNPSYELSYRVWVELWKRGEKVNGTYSSGGLLYPAYPNTVYVEWSPRWIIFGFGIGRKIRSMTGPAAVWKALNARRQLGRPLLESDIPDGIKILDKSEAGIDPYEFLNLPKPK